jgi:short-subunit dehydrogenase
MAPRWRVAWITGASSGLGRELAIRLARQGVKVAASARSAEALAELAASTPGISPYPLDVGDRAATAKTIAAIEREVGPIDLAVLNAGYWQAMSIDSFNVEVIERGLTVNYLAMIYALETLAPAMCQRRSGHIAMVASVAGFVGLPRSIAYGPSKAAVIALGQSMKIDLERDNVDVTVICPGFVDTPMTKVNKFPMPFLMTTEKAVDKMIAGLERRRFDVTFPWQMSLLMGAARRIPPAVLFWFLRRMDPIGPGRTPRS